MNTPTHITVTNPQVSNQTTDSGKTALPILPPEVLAAKNIQFSKDSVTLDVFMNKHWQTIRLTVNDAPTNVEKIASANIQLSADGKSLTIIPNNSTLSIKQPEQLQRFLNFINTQSDIQNNPLSIQVTLKPTPKLVIEKFNASIAINKQIAQLLAEEPLLKGIIETDGKGTRLNIINRFADIVHSQPLSQAKLTQLVANNLGHAQLHAMPKFAVLTQNTAKSSLNISLSHQQLSELPTAPTKVTISSQADKLLIKTAYQNITVELKNSFSKPFNEMLSQQPQVAIDSQKIKPHPLSTVNSPIQSWLKSSFADFKTRILDAVKHFESKPFTTALNVSQKPNVVNEQQKWLTPTQKIDITQLKSPLGTAPPLVQLTQQLKTSISLWQQRTLSTSVDLHPVVTQSAQTANRSLAAVNHLQPLEKLLLATVLKQTATAPIEQKEASKHVLSSQLNTIVTKAADQGTDLNRLVNQAFNRILSESNLHPTTIQREILSTIKPTQLTSDTLQSSFNRGVEQLSLSILAAPIINQNPTAVSINNQSGLEALLQVLLPSFKTGNNTNKLLEQLQQPQVQALAGELTQIKNTLSQVQAPVLSQQPDTNSLVQFLLPMKLPPEAAQTEISLGQYKKPNNDKLADKNVWFVRLNFDYAELGKLQITAELMDKALDCQLLASTQAVSALAHPHLDNLRSKLAKQGLQVGDLNLKRADDNHQAFYQSHAIINIKV
ncbi:flagellar hook-length control protein FliK [Pseudoalteromonas sp. meg-B1]|uniref:flagellar hook-length control protein FliK n=1 Tax=Pseudoalteromonas sp. meg-B1 TaxID=2203192 RepID=UPI000D6EE442|nr:flagellar hook-length control protein FliK [Pseudoalteromonas sp. meg-B1]PWS55698.1 flagellar hook-length control protein FliK [Pseudoalteromonas sp. meg-B1]